MVKTMNRDKQSQKVGAGGTLYKVPETQELRHSKDSIGVALAKMPNIREDVLLQ